MKQETDKYYFLRAKARIFLGIGQRSADLRPAARESRGQVGGSARMGRPAERANYSGMLQPPRHIDGACIFEAAERLAGSVG